MTSCALVTGAAGFVGRHLIGYLHGQGLVVHGLEHPGVPVPSDSDVCWHVCDVTDAAQTLAVVDQIQPDYVFHLAALIKSKSFADLLAVNVVGTQYVLDAVVAANPEARVLVTGSSAEYGLARQGELPIKEDHPLRPLQPYGVSKVAQSLRAAQYAHNHGMHVVRVRTFNLTGPGEPKTLVCSAFARQIAEIEQGLRSPVLQVGNLESARDFVDVRDAVRAYWLAVQHGSAGEVYNVCSGTPVVIRDVLDMLVREARATMRTQGDEGRDASGDAPLQYGDATRLHRTTGWSPAISLQTSLRDLLDFWRARVAGPLPGLSSSAAIQ